MTKATGSVYDVQVTSRGKAQAVRDPAAPPYADLEQALAAIRQRYLSSDAGEQMVRGGDRIDIVVDAPNGAAANNKGEPRYEFFVDPLAIDGGASTGTASAPWPSLAIALLRLEEMHNSGQMAPSPGERIRLVVREPFGSTPFDVRKRRTELAAKTVLFCMTLMLVIPLVAILAYLFLKAAPVLTPSFILENPRNNMKAGGIWAPLIGTFYLVFFSLLAAAPVGILAGVYLNEYARDNWFTRVINLAVVNLAGVPSIVHALFGVGAFVVFANFGESVLAASMTLAVMTLPVIIASTKEALAGVPRSFREACWNMGATRWQTIRTIVLPNSISGILTGVILQVSRAAGETAPILFTGAAFSVTVPDEGWESFFPYGLYDSCMALSYHLHVMLTQVPPASPAEIEAGKAMPLEYLQFGTAVVLIGLVLFVNSFSIGLRLYLRSRKRW
jgi:phosphate transport system permease protein